MWALLLLIIRKLSARPVIFCFFLQSDTQLSGDIGSDMVVIFDVAKHIFDADIKQPYRKTESKPHYSGYNPAGNMAVVEPQFYAELKYSDEAEYDAAASGYREHQSDEQAESLNDGVPYFCNCKS